MRKVTSFAALPAHATYLCSTAGGSITESESFTLDLAIEPVFFDDETGRHFFDAAREV